MLAERQSKVIAVHPVKAVFSKDPSHRQVFSGCRVVLTSTAAPAILDWLKEQIGGK